MKSNIFPQDHKVLRWQQRSLCALVCQMDRKALQPASTSLRSSAALLCKLSQMSFTGQLEKSQISVFHSSHSTQQLRSAKSDSEHIFVAWRSWKSNQPVAEGIFSIRSSSQPAQGRSFLGTKKSLPPSVSPHHSPSHCFDKHRYCSITLPYLPHCDSGFLKHKTGINPLFFLAQWLLAIRSRAHTGL